MAAGSPPSGVMPLRQQLAEAAVADDEQMNRTLLPQLVPAALGQGEHVGVKRPAERLLRGHYQ